MRRTAAEKVIAQHLAGGKMDPDEEIAFKIDHTLTQDSTGTLTYLEFEAMGVRKVKTQLSLSFVDHNMLQNDFRNQMITATCKKSLQNTVLFSLVQETESVTNFISNVSLNLV